MLFPGASGGQTELGQTYWLLQIEAIILVPCSELQEKQARIMQCSVNDIENLIVMNAFRPETVFKPGGLY